MSTHLGWPEIALRLVLATVAAAVIGLDRGEHGRPAGLRTTLLVCLAATISMIQTNLLLMTAGRPSDSFIMMDLMRLPLGILTGVGFIGGGAILKKDDIVLGVTTAATLWFVTVIGLCFGGGQIGLGAAGFAIAIIVLKGLKRLEAILPQDHRATLTVTGNTAETTEEDVRAEIARFGFRITCSRIVYNREDGTWTIASDVRWRARTADPATPALLKEFAARPGISRVDWCPQGRPNVRAD